MRILDGRRAGDCAGVRDDECCWISDGRCCPRVEKVGGSEVSWSGRKDLRDGMRRRFRGGEVEYSVIALFRGGSFGVDVGVPMVVVGISSFGVPSMSLCFTTWRSKRREYERLVNGRRRLEVQL